VPGMFWDPFDIVGMCSFMCSLVPLGTVIRVAVSGNYGGYGFWLPAEGGARSGARRIECVLHSATDAEAPAHSRPRKQQRDAPALLGLPTKRRPRTSLGQAMHCCRFGTCRNSPGLVHRCAKTARGPRH
jgi:hypothetical protein